MSILETKNYPFRLLVEITFHFRESRLQYLFQVIRALCEFPIEKLDIVVSTNIDDETSIGQIKRLVEPLLVEFPLRPNSKKGLSIASFPGLSDPWLLPWTHKRLISDQFLSAASDYTHFIHLEDDILLSFDNFCYFVHFRDELKGLGLIPSFQRIEFNDQDNRLYLLDQIGHSSFDHAKRVDVGRYRFVNLDFPHVAMFILDRELAKEYVATRSFDVERSKEVKPDWGVCERASMGLCFESPPKGFDLRYVSPVDISSRMTPRWSWVYHVANNYSKNRMKPFAKTRVEDLFGVGDSVRAWQPPSRAEKMLDLLQRKVLHRAR